MVHLNADQERAILNIKEAKTAYDRWVSAATLEFEAMKSAQKEPIRKLVGKAIEDGIPVRQIHQRGMDYAQVTSMTNFLDRGAGRFGKAGLLEILHGLAAIAPMPLLGATVPPSEAAPKLRQGESGTEKAYWIDPTTGEEKWANRGTSPADFYVMYDWDIAALTPEELDMFMNDEKTLMGQAEWDEYMQNGNMPERWDNQPDASVKKIMR